METYTEFFFPWDYSYEQLSSKSFKDFNMLNMRSSKLISVNDAEISRHC